MVSLSVTYTGFAGYVIAGHIIDGKLFIVLLGIFLLSSGASAFNHIFERQTDALMERTRNRPIPAGRLSLKAAFYIAIINSIIGSLILFFSSGWLVAILGIFNLVWYDFIYTPLKKRTVWAVFVGTITGVIPFYMGYLSVLIEFPSVKAHFIAIFLLVWQIPHFMLLLGIYGKEYEKAGLASITSKTKEPNLYRIAVLWIIACCIISFLLPLFKISNYNTTNYLILVISGIVLLWAVLSLFYRIKRKYKLLFVVSNLMQMAIITLLLIDSML
jgi:protoheme IX farnesyltransferase